MIPEVTYEAHRKSQRHTHQHFAGMIFEIFRVERIVLQRVASPHRPEHLSYPVTGTPMRNESEFRILIEGGMLVVTITVSGHTDRWDTRRQVPSNMLDGNCDIADGAASRVITDKSDKFFFILMQRIAGLVFLPM